MPDPTKEEEGFSNPDRFGDIGLDWLTIIKPDDEASKKEDVADPEEEKQADAG